MKELWLWLMALTALAMSFFLFTMMTPSKAKAQSVTGLSEILEWFKDNVEEPKKVPEYIPEPSEEYQLRQMDKKYLRLQFTEFCASVGRPPEILVAPLNQAFAIDPDSWGPAVLWWNKIMMKYKAAGCADA